VVTLFVNAARAAAEPQLLKGQEQIPGRTLLQ
jgi:hypothetical protein